MRILVCIKQVLDSESPIVLDERAHWIEEHTRCTWIMNRYDEFALEEALLIGERHADVHIDALTVGPPRAAAVVKKALEKGAHDAIHLRVDDPSLSAAQTAALIAGYIADTSYDLILTGVMSEDLMQAQVGPTLAALRGVPCAASVVSQSCDIDTGTIRARIELDGGGHEVVDLPMPCVLTIQSGINQPRYPSLSNVLRAKKIEPLTAICDIATVAARRDRVESIDFPERLKNVIMIDGTPGEKAAVLLSLLNEKGVLR
ncbi:MAG TPA: electron transfer flavoprotein subunit beta/FixA family protein [Spirochaetota bacterium]|nr:electron transfer flavoprotein subunit beta/FixA family protein [Spirochaetota bacterium]HNT10662.1 electron transfer flavoprotein subunit beta/FixA family protein [Spirochaetota bacterium]